MKTILPIIFCLIHVIPSNAEEEQPPPIVAHFINSGDFKTWNNQKLPKSISDGVMNLLKQAAGTFSASTMDCRMPDHGPMASLAPKHTVSFTTHSNESASIDLFVFSEDYSVLQVSIDSKPKKYFRSLDKKLINDFSTIMTKKTEIEQDAAGQPATRPESKPEGNQKPQPKSEGRSR